MSFLGITFKNIIKFTSYILRSPSYSEYSHWQCSWPNECKK